MGIFDNPPSGFQNNEFWLWMLRTINTANSETDAINQRISKSGDSVQSDEVANARIDLHGKIYMALASREDATQATAEKALDIANTKADADATNLRIAQMGSASPSESMSASASESVSASSSITQSEVRSESL